MGCHINLANYCVEIGLSFDSAMFFVYEGVISATKQEESFFVDENTALTLRLLAEIENDLGVNHEGASVILDMRDKIIKYQSILKTVFELIEKSKSIDELVFKLNEKDIFGKIVNSGEI